MGVMFTTGQFEEDPEHGTILVCGTRHDHVRPAACCPDAADYRGQCEHAEADEAACGCTAADVQVSNANAAKLLELLGYRTDAEPEGEALGGIIQLYGEQAGHATPGEFLGRIAVARALLDVATGDSRGTPPVTTGGPGTGRAQVTDMGRRPGYLASRLDDLERLARAAQVADILITWA